MPFSESTNPNDSRTVVGEIFNTLKKEQRQEQIDKWKKRVSEFVAANNKEELPNAEGFRRAKMVDFDDLSAAVEIAEDGSVEIKALWIPQFEGEERKYWQGVGLSGEEKNSGDINHLQEVEFEKAKEYLEQIFISDIAILGVAGEKQQADDLGWAYASLKEAGRLSNNPWPVIIVSNNSNEREAGLDNNPTWHRDERRLWFCNKDEALRRLSWRPRKIETGDRKVIDSLRGGQIKTGVSDIIIITEWRREGSSGVLDEIRKGQTETENEFELPPIIGEGEKKLVLFEEVKKKNIPIFDLRGLDSREILDITLAARQLAYDPDPARRRQVILVVGKDSSTESVTASLQPPKGTMLQVLEVKTTPGGSKIDSYSVKAEEGGSDLKNALKFSWGEPKKK